jgi:hypothetical protein
MNRFALAVSCAALVLGLNATSARATEVAFGYANYNLTSFTLTSAGAGVYDFAFSGSGQTGSGAFSTSTTSSAGKFLITGISGTVDGTTIASLFAPGTYPFSLGGADNDLFAPSIVTAPNTIPGYLDITGVSFGLANGTDYDLYFGNFLTGDPQMYDLLTAAPTPEPPSLLMLGTGVIALAGAGFTRQRYVLARVKAKQGSTNRR